MKTLNLSGLISGDYTDLVTNELIERLQIGIFKIVEDFATMENLQVVISPDPEELYIVAHTSIEDEMDYYIPFIEDNALAEAKKHYEALLQDEDVYTASLCKIIMSTDYGAVGGVKRLIIVEFNNNDYKCREIEHEGIIYIIAPLDLKASLFNFKENIIRFHGGNNEVVDKTFYYLPQTQILNWTDEKIKMEVFGGKDGGLK